MDETLIKKNIQFAVIQNYDDKTIILYFHESINGIVLNQETAKKLGNLLLANLDKPN